MPSDYREITKDNVRRRGTHFDDIGRWISEQFYSDRTHFIYELLQNAEDALRRRFREGPNSKLPCRVQFRLLPDRLEFRHFGKLFDEEDVRAISDILKGTKAGDMNQIGKFGIGFKSVYAFTSTPEIHSGDEHFVIERYIRPRRSEQIPKVKDQETCFIFPFNHDQVTPEDSLLLISNRLSKIGVRTLLFLKHIDEIEWLVGNESKGIYFKEEKQNIDAKHVAVIGQNNNTEESENWLVFERPIPLTENNDAVNVEVAFRLERDNKTGKEKIVKSRASPLVVFFPTEVETRFGFIIQGPYTTTPSRDNIPKEDDWNKRLVRETAVLVRETLPKVKKMGLLNVSLLEALPIRFDDFPEDGMFRPIYDSVREILRESSLLPTDKDSFVSARNAKLARGSDLRRLLNITQLQHLFISEDSPRWLSGDITEIQTIDLWKYLTQELDIEVIDPDSFARRVHLDFLQNQTDKWMIEFYSYISGLEALWRPATRRTFMNTPPGPLRNKEIIRLSDNRHVKPFKLDGSRPEVFLPTDATPSHYQMVKANIIENEKVLEFLKNLGIREVGEKESIETILNSFYLKDSPDPTPNDHIKHIKRFVAWHQKGGDKKIFAGYYLFHDEEQKKFYTSDSCFLDLPFKDTGLRCLFESDPQDEQEPGRVALWEEYNKIEGFIDFAVSLGVIDGLKIVNRTTWNNPAKAYLYIDYYARHTYTKIDEDYSIDHLDALLSRKNINISKLIWTTLRGADPIVLTARFRPNQQYTTRTAPSLLVCTLKKYDWIPDRHSEFCTPANITKDMLPDGFIYDDRNGWLSAIGFGSEAQDIVKENEEKQKHAQALGIKNLESIEIIREIEENPDLLVKIRSVIDSEKKAVLFPIHQSPKPERREQKMAEDIQGAPDKAYGLRERSIRTSLPPKQDKEIFLRESYTNIDGQMVCQICKREMPFRKRDGHYYFEAVEVLSDQDIEHEALYIALCPLCAAMYKEFVKRDANSMSNLKESIITAEKPEIAVCLGQLQTTIKFVETHFLDLKTIIKEVDRT